MNNISHILRILSIAGFLVLLSSCSNAKKIDQCDDSNIYNSMICYNKKNAKLIGELNNYNNEKRKDYYGWDAEIKQKCNKLSHSLGEGASLERAVCLNLEYKNRLEYIKTGRFQPIEKAKNDDGFTITNLPYSSVNHIGCLIKKDKDKCSKINLISTDELSKVYNFVKRNEGDSVVLPENKNGLLVVISPFEEETGENLLHIISVDSNGVVDNKYIPADGKVIIDENYNLIYKDGNEEKMIQLK